MGADHSSLHTDQRSLPGTQTEEEKGMDHSRYLVGQREQETTEEEIHGHQIREAEKETQAAEPRSRPESEDDDNGRQAGLHGRCG